MPPTVKAPVPSWKTVRKSTAKVPVVSKQPRQNKGRFSGNAVKVEPIEGETDPLPDALPEDAIVVDAPDRTSFAGADIALLDAILVASNVDVLENGCGLCCREWSISVQRRRDRGTACKTCSNLMVKIFPVTISEFRAYEFH